MSPKTGIKKKPIQYLYLSVIFFKAKLALIAIFEKIKTNKTLMSIFSFCFYLGKCLFVFN